MSEAVAVLFLPWLRRIVAGFVPGEVLWLVADLDCLFGSVGLLSCLATAAVVVDCMIRIAGMRVALKMHVTFLVVSVSLYMAVI